MALVRFQYIKSEGNWQRDFRELFGPKASTIYPGRWPPVIYFPLLLLMLHRMYPYFLVATWTTEDIFSGPHLFGAPGPPLRWTPVRGYTCNLQPFKHRGGVGLGVIYPPPSAEKVSLGEWDLVFVWFHLRYYYYYYYPIPPEGEWDLVFVWFHLRYYYYTRSSSSSSKGWSDFTLLLKLSQWNLVGT